MRIAGEIVNSRSAAADLTQSRSTRSATRRLDTKAGDSYCSLSPARPFGVKASTDLSEELPKKRRRTEVFVSSNWQPWCPSAGTFSNIDLGFLRRVPSASGLCLSAPVARGVLGHRPIIARSKNEDAARGRLPRDETPRPLRKTLGAEEFGEGGGHPPRPRAPRRPEQLSKWPQERAVLKLVL